MFIFPGVGLAAIVGEFETIPPNVFTTAAMALAECVKEEDFAEGAIYPRVRKLRDVSVHVARRVLEEYIYENPDCGLSLDGLEDSIRAAMWIPEYLPYRRV